MAKYISVDDFMSRLPENHKPLLYHIRATIMNADPQMREKISFNTIFFTCVDLVAYVGKVRKDNFEICFAKGVLLSNEHGILDLKDRKLAAGVTFEGWDDYKEKEEAFLESLHEAILFNLENPGHKFLENGDEWRRAEVVVVIRLPSYNSNLCLIY